MITFETSKSTALEPVPNGTALVATRLSRLDELVEQYQMFARKSAKVTLDLGETVFIADSELNKTDLQEFCKRVGLDRKGSRYRRMRIVGRKRSRFEPFLDRLPPRWTTLATMGSLQPGQFDRVVNDSRFGPKMTGADIGEILGRVRGKSTGGKHRERLPHCSIYFDGLDPSMRHEARNELIELSPRCGFILEFNEEVGECDGASQ
jgi:hypothetical protein